MRRRPGSRPPDHAHQPYRGARATERPGAPPVFALQVPALWRVEHGSVRRRGRLLRLLRAHRAGHPSRACYSTKGRRAWWEPGVACRGSFPLAGRAPAAPPSSRLNLSANFHHSLKIRPRNSFVSFGDRPTYPQIQTPRQNDLRPFCARGVVGHGGWGDRARAGQGQAGRARLTRSARYAARITWAGQNPLHVVHSCLPGERITPGGTAERARIHGPHSLICLGKRLVGARGFEPLTPAV